MDKRDLALDRVITAAARDVLAERLRQQEAEGWTPEHDDSHSRGELARAAACYASPDDVSYTDSFDRPLDANGNPRPLSPNEARRKWSYRPALRRPWAREWWKPGNRRRNLVKAGALILAEMERLDRAAAKAEAVCPVCRKKLSGEKGAVAHLAQAHGITAAEAERRFGLKPSRR